MIENKNNIHSGTIMKSDVFPQQVDILWAISLGLYETFDYKLIIWSFSWDDSVCKPVSLCPAGEADDRDQSKLEEKLWDPECPLTNKQIDQFLVVAR